MNHPDGVVSRFWLYVRKTGGCWEWTGCRRPDGYGVLGLCSKRLVRAHRLSWEISYRRPVPAGMFVCHHCDNRGCVRPEHLFLGTAADNSADMRKKGRHVDPPPQFGARNPRRITPPVGEINPAAKLTWNDVRRLRAAWLAGATTTELASRFAISRTTAHRAATGATWR